MKKLLLIAMLVAGVFSASADNYVVVGTFNDWDHATGVQLTGDSDETLSCTIPDLSAGFKIVNADALDSNNDWTEQYGLLENANITFGETVELVKVTGNEGNISFAYGIESVENAIVLFNASNKEMIVLPGSNWILVGAYNNNWTWDHATVLSGDDSELVGYVLDLSSNFKILNKTANNWHTQYGSSDKIRIGESLTLIYGQDNETQPAAIQFEDGISSVKFAKVTFNPTTQGVTVEAGYYPDLYLTGDFCGWKAPGEVGVVEMSFDNTTKIYSGSYPVYAGSTQEFKIVGYGWTNEIGASNAVASVGSSEVTTGVLGAQTSAENFKNLSVDSSLSNSEAHTLYFNPVTMDMAFDDASLVAGSTIPVLNSITATGIGTFKATLPLSISDETAVAEGLTVAYTIAVGDNTYTTTGTAGTTVDYVVPNLLPSTEYNISVTAAYGQNVSNTQTVEVTTNQLPYNTPRSLPTYTSYLFGPAYDELYQPVVATTGTPAPVYSIVKTAAAPSSTPDSVSPARVATEDDETEEPLSTLSVIAVNGMTADNSIAVEGLRYLEKATEFYLSLYSETAGTINVTGYWEGGKSETTSISVNASGWENNNPIINATDIGYSTGGTNNQNTHLTKIVFSGASDAENLVPQFAISAIAFPSSEPLSVDEVEVVDNGVVDVYNLQGIRVKSGVQAADALQALPKGIYIVNGKKSIVK